MSGKKRLGLQETMSNGQSWTSSASNASSTNSKDRIALKMSQDTGSNSHFNSEHESFFHAFEKPTQIYRFLRTRQLARPVFLHRTLTYMRHRVQRKSTKKRKDFKVDSMLQIVENKQKRDSQAKSSGNLTLVFSAAYDNTLKAENVKMIVETALLKTCYKKRRDSTNLPSVQQYPVGQVVVDVNPSESRMSGTVLTILKDSFPQTNGHLVKSFSLLFNAHYKSESNDLNGMHNGISSADEDDNCDSPHAKRRKLAGSIDNCFYQAELTIFDRTNQNLLIDGEYQVVFQKCPISQQPKFSSNTSCSPSRHSKIATWEALPAEDIVTLNGEMRQYSAFDVFQKGPVLEFHANWGEVPRNGIIPSKPLSLPHISKLLVANNNENNSSVGNTDDPTAGKNDEASNSATAMVTAKPHRVIYQFLYNNNTRQQTRPREDYHCPWCSLNCVKLYSLLKHLKLCHCRFAFAYGNHPKGARIDVSINDCYDGSYAGNPHDISFGCAFARNGPFRRSPVTQTLVCRPKRLPPSLAEFTEFDDEFADGTNNRPFTSGHNRLYYHTTTCLPVRAQEMDYDSEAESDPEWLQEKTQLMIDEFTDVNEGEKDVMKMWNLHVMKNGFVGDCQIGSACSTFIEKKGREIWSKKLYKNFVLHLNNLVDFGVLSVAQMTTFVRMVQEMRNNNTKEDGKEESPKTTKQKQKQTETL